MNSAPNPPSSPPSSIPQRLAMTLPAPGDVTATLELARMAEGEGYDDV